MFRLLVYLHDTRHARGRPFFHTVSYFFQLPNVCFTLYPVIDFKTYCSNYRTTNLTPVHQTGIAWIVRGLVHLLAYRAIRYYLLPTPHQLTDLPQVAWFLAANYASLSAFRVRSTSSLAFCICSATSRAHSSQLFPGIELHRHLAASASTGRTSWPSWSSSRLCLPCRFGEKTAFATATLCVFAATWLCHVYQVFWLLGTVPISLEGGSLWLVAGILVAINMLIELRRSDAGTPSPQLPNLLQAASLSLKTVGMFLLISVFWAFWNTPNIVREIPARCQPSLAGAATLLGVLTLAVSTGVIAQLARRRFQPYLSEPSQRYSAASAVCLSGVLFIFVLVATLPITGLLGRARLHSPACGQNPRLPWAARRCRLLRRDLATHVSPDPGWP